MLLAVRCDFSTGGGVSSVNTSRAVLGFIALFKLAAPLAAQGMAEVIKRFERACQIPGPQSHYHGLAGAVFA